MTNPKTQCHVNLSSQLKKLYLHHSHLLTRIMFLTKLERLKLAAYLCLIADFTKSPNDDIYDGDGEKRGIRRKKAHEIYVGIFWVSFREHLCLEVRYTYDLEVRREISPRERPTASPLGVAEPRRDRAACQFGGLKLAIFEIGRAHV